LGLDGTRAHGLVERERDGAGARVAVLVQVMDDLRVRVGVKVRARVMNNLVQVLGQVQVLLGQV